MKIQDYKGFEIEYNEGYEEGFSVVGSDAKKFKLSEIKKYIDRVKGKKFKRFKILKLDYGGRTEEVEVTSHDDGDYFWTINSRGRREKMNSEHLIKINKDNINKLDKIKELKKESSELREKWNEVEKSLDRLNPEDYKIKDVKGDLNE